MASILKLSTSFIVPPLRSTSSGHTPTSLRLFPTRRPSSIIRASGSASGWNDREEYALGSALMTQEDDIISSLMRRSAYPSNSPTYSSFASTKSNYSILEYSMREIERVYSQLGLYTAFEEFPFFPPEGGLPQSLLPAQHHPIQLHPIARSINFNDRVWEVYFIDLLPPLVCEGDDGSYAATALSDAACLRAISRRVHSGRIIAEVAFRSAPDQFVGAIKAQDADTLMSLVTMPGIDSVRMRIEKKVILSSILDRRDDIQPNVLADIYCDRVLPLIKEVQVSYLMRRLD